MVIPTIHVFPTPGELAAEAASRFIRSAEEAIIATGRFAVALSGGSTPQAMFKLLASDELAGKVDWGKTHILFADERCVPPGDSQSNFGRACRLLLDHVAIPYEQIHRMMGEDDPQHAADEYDAMLHKDFPTGVDLILLGIGEDGHTASLFPGTRALDAASDRFCVANQVPQMDSWRLTLTAAYINSAFEVLLLVSGIAKAPVARVVLEGQARPGQYPISLIQPKTSRLTWLMDVHAAGMDEEKADESAN